MSSVSALAQGVLNDLQKRRLLPVAGLLVIILIALPLFMLKPSEPVPAAPAAPAAAASANGLPSPEEALGSAGKPLVSLAVLDRPSDLDSFESKNPFKPLNQVSTAGATPGTATSPGGSGSGGSSSGGSFTVDKGATGGGGGTGGGSPSPGSTPSPGGSPTPSPQPETPSSPEPPAKERKLTYAVDATLSGPSRTVRYRSISKLTMLPTEAQPVLIFLGVDSSGQKAVFLVDSSLTVTGGEGTCSPSTEQCATVALEPGEQMRFSNGQGGTYELQIDQIREVSTVKAARAAARKLERAKARSASEPVRRFVPPIITDLFTGGR